MDTLGAKKVDWLYEHFQAISQASNQYFYALGVVTAFSLAAFLSTEQAFTVPIIDLLLPRDLVMSSLTLVGAFLVVAYCGNYDKGEATIQSLAEVLRCQYEDLECIDSHPNVFDFAKYARKDTVDCRWLIARFSVAMLYP